ncbi:MAG: DUF3047 domain-containing protein [Candidatus Omnitrophica bacterium]|nr:DUF3047 domain-containing protein [Candidatus Omnitrophota bacterium]MDD4012931.1 DUF3047 domain-containing protein [Candidatus Omnitrophota bacterium]
MRTPKRFLIFFFVLVAVLALLLAFTLVRFSISPGREDIETKRVLREFSFNSDKDISMWEEKALCPKKTAYSLGEITGRLCLEAQAVDSASALFYKETLDHRQKPYVEWEWIARKFPDWKGQESLQKKSDFDFVAQFYVVFYARFFPKARAIQYVWTESLPVGTVSDSPYTSNVKILVLESGLSDEWKQERRDISADYLDLFGEPLDKDVVAVSFMADADSTDSSASSGLSNVRIGYIGPSKEEGNDGDTGIPTKGPEESSRRKDQGKEQPSDT